jgi:hypothetical protein
MKSRLTAIAGIALLLCALAACVSGRPLIKEPVFAGSLGIAAFTPVMMESGQLLWETEGAFFDPLDVEGVTHMVAILSPSPDAASRFAVTASSLASMCRKIWVEEIGQSRSAVKDIEDPGVRRDSEQCALREIAERSGVSALLVVEPSVCAEVGQVTEQSSRSPFGKDIPVGNSLLRIVIFYRFWLFNAETGRPAPSADRPAGTAGQFSDAETCLYDLGPMTRQQVVAFMNTEAYSALFDKALRKALKPLLPLFRTSVEATP